VTPPGTFDITYAGETVTLADLPEYGKFYAKLAAGTWEPHTFAELRKWLTPETTYLDIGAWIGVTPFWASRIARRVIAIEPDPKCREILKSLLPLYPNVTLIEGALSPEARVTVHAVDGFGSSETSILNIGDEASLDVPGLAAQDLLAAAGPGPLAVKIDIEGYEFAIADELEKLAAAKPRGLQLAVHPQLFEKSLNQRRFLARPRTIAATVGLYRSLARHFPSARVRKYAGLPTYLAGGLLFRREPRATDWSFETTT
jgi:FkbM family methyltransferase